MVGLFLTGVGGDHTRAERKANIGYSHQLDTDATPNEYSVCWMFNQLFAVGVVQICQVCMGFFLVLATVFMSVLRKNALDWVHMSAVFPNNKTKTTAFVDKES